MNKPSIRNKGYTDAWEQRKLGDISDSYSGGTPTAGKAEYYGGCIPFIRSAEVNSDTTELFLTDEGLKNSSAKMVKKGDILYALYGATSGEVGLARLDGAINQAILDIKPHEGYDAPFLMQWLRKNKESIIGTYLQGGQGNLSGTIVTSLIVNCPNYEEQKLIGKFFANLDNLITLHQREIEKLNNIKLGFVQKLFPHGDSKKPEIRFDGYKDKHEIYHKFTKEWEQRKLGKICERVIRKNRNNESDRPLTIASRQGLIDQRDFFNKIVAAKDMSNYYLLKKGEFAYNKSYSDGYDYGSIKRLNAYEHGCLSTLYICFAITAEDVNSDYLECYFDTLNWYSDVSEICSEGARNHGLLNVDTKAFFENVSVYLPPYQEEQQMISEFLYNLDNLITLHQRELDIMKRLKTGYLQKMFV